MDEPSHAHMVASAAAELGRMATPSDKVAAFMGAFGGWALRACHPPALRTALHGFDVKVQDQALKDGTLGL